MSYDHSSVRKTLELPNHIGPQTGYSLRRQACSFWPACGAFGKATKTELRPP